MYGRHATSVPVGFTLLEVILAIAILGVSVVAIGGITKISYHNAQLASEELEAKLLAESIMAELLTGGREVVAVAPTPIETVPEEQPVYQFAIAVEASPLPSMLLLRVQVAPVGEDRDVRPLCELVRWMVDPAYIEEIAAAASATATQ